MAGGIAVGLGAVLPFSSAAISSGMQGSLPETLHKGVSLSDWFQYSGKSRPTVEQLRGLRKAGMDHVRLPVDPQFIGWRPDSSAGESVFAKLDELDDAIHAITEAGLVVNLDFHPGQESIQYLKQNRSRVESVLMRSLIAMVGRYKQLGDRKICFELMNEPHRFCPEAERWHAVQGRLIQAVRQEAPTHWLVANGVWDPLSTFRTLEVYPDNRIMYSFHFYKPYILTHQGAKWEPSAARLFPYIQEVPYPSRNMHAARKHLKAGSDEDYVTGELNKYRDENWDIDRLRKELAVSINWAQQRKVPIICTEFGVMRGAVDADSRLRWLADVARVFAENNVPWTVWDYCNDFGIAQCGAHATVIEPEVVKALGLQS